MFIFENENFLQCYPNSKANQEAHLASSERVTWGISALSKFEGSPGIFRERILRYFSDVVVGSLEVVAVFIRHEYLDAGLVFGTRRRGDLGCGFRRRHAGRWCGRLRVIHVVVKSFVNRHFLNEFLRLFLWNTGIKFGLIWRMEPQKIDCLLFYSVLVLFQAIKHTKLTLTLNLTQ